MNQKALHRMLLGVIKERGHEVLALANGGSHFKATVRLSDGREVKISLPGSPSCGERVARDFLMLHLRRAERGLMIGGRRDRD